VSERGKADFDADRCTVFPEQSAGELAAVVGDDAIRHAKTAYHPTDELDCRPGRDSAHRLHLCPLGKLVDGDVEVAVAPLRTTPNRSVVFTPFFLVYGAEEVLPTDIEFDTPRVVQFMQEQAKEACEDGIDLLEEAREQALARSALY
jgi:hypothetical protein